MDDALKQRLETIARSLPAPTRAAVGHLIEGVLARTADGAPDDHALRVAVWRALHLLDIAPLLPTP